ncbi:MAG: ABC transporter substrate-binding protein [Desulfovibrio sp.]|jgi:phospholipid transport system substrate-binding protein|nr:ABC transporter substrate-binding protein [Desulfovibrio sp.]
MTRLIRNYGAPLLLAAALIFSMAAGQAAASAAEARAILETTINQVFDEMKKPELQNPDERDAVLDRIENIVRSLFSFEELSMRTVGPAWKNFSADQKKRFIDAFGDLLRERYLGSLDGYSGETVSYLGETSSTKGDRVEVQTNIIVDNKPVPVNYRMLKKDRWLVYDVIIEGVSMVQNYRSQFQTVLDKGDAEQLISLVRDKAAETRAEQNKK